MIPGEYDDIDIGVVFRLLQGSGEPEYSDDGLLITGAAGNPCERVNSLEAARACSPGIRVGGNSVGRVRLYIAGGERLVVEGL